MAKTSSIPSLPMEALREAIDLTQKFINGDDSSRMSLFLISGVFTTPETRKLILLPWSPLRTATSATVQQSQNITHDGALRWFLNKLSEAVFDFDDKVRDMCRREWPQRCIKVVTHGMSSPHSPLSGMRLTPT